MNVLKVTVSIVVAALLFSCYPGANDPAEVRCVYAANEVCGRFVIGEGQRECRRKVFSECMENPK